MRGVFLVLFNCSCRTHIREFRSRAAAASLCRAKALFCAYRDCGRHCSLGSLIHQQICKCVRKSLQHAHVRPSCVLHLKAVRCFSGKMSKKCELKINYRRFHATRHCCKLVCDRRMCAFASESAFCVRRALRLHSYTHTHSRSQVITHKSVL